MRFSLGRFLKIQLRMKSFPNKLTFSVWEKNLFDCFHFLQLALVEVVDLRGDLLPGNVYFTHVKILLSIKALTFCFWKNVLLDDFLVLQLVLLKILYFTEKLR